MVERSRTVERTFAALGDPTRLRIVERLARGPVTMTVLAEPFPMSLAAVSKHVSILQDAGLVARIRRGRMVECRLRPAAMREAVAWMERARRWSRRLDRLAAVVEGER